MMYIASVFSQLERETIAERIRDNMHELAKTGRWLGGVTPTGYASESVKSVTVDGKAKKACMLRLIPGEAEVVRTIYELFSANQSLTQTEAELIRRGSLTKNGRQFTRFSIRSILQNPVYAMADRDVYDYMISREADLFSEEAEFDGVHGLLAYHRTDQEKGRATVYLPVSEWIVAVGRHPGIIPGRVWVSVQEALEQNRTRSFRRPRSNEALLTGLMYCSCGNRMYPKLSGRVAADGKPAYTYVCRMKERSQRTLCDGKNVSGNALDGAVIGQIRGLQEDRERLIDQLTRSRRGYGDNRCQHEAQLARARQEKAELEKKIGMLVDSLAELGESGAKAPILRRIEQMHRDCEAVEARIRELTDLASRHALSDGAFDGMRRTLSAFGASFDEMPVERKRAALRALVREVVWDGVNAHVLLPGASDEEAGLFRARWREDSK